MNPLSRRVAGFAILLVFGSVSVTKAQTVLRWHFEQGATYKHRTVQRITTEVEGPQGSIQVNMQQEFYTTQRVKSVGSDGSAVLEVTTDRIVMKMNLPTGEIAYDSSQDQAPMDPAGQQIVAAMKPLIGARIVATVDSRGKVLKLELPEALKGAIQQNPVLQGQDDQIFRNAGGQSLIIFPEQPVRPGATWSSEAQKLNLPFGKLDATTTYTYAGQVQTEQGTAHKIGIDLRLSSEPAKDAPFTIEVTDHSGKGEAYIDSNLTHIIKSSLKQRITLTINAQGQQIVQKLSTDTLVEALPATGSSR